MYAALTIATHPSIVPGTQIGDRWSLSAISLATDDVSASLVEVALHPQPGIGAVGAETVSLSGFGLAPQ